MYFGYLYSAYPRVSSKRFTFTHTFGCATWVTLESRIHNSGAHDQSSLVSFSRASFSSRFFLHSYFTFFSARFLSSLDLNSPSELPIIKLIKILFNFDGGGNQSARRNPLVRDPRRKSLLYGATYLVPRAGIEPTPRTDTGYRPVSQTRQMRREPLGHHVPLYLSYNVLFSVLFPFTP
jgi:hypothetical protein